MEIQFTVSSSKFQWSELCRPLYKIHCHHIHFCLVLHTNCRFFHCQYRRLNLERRDWERFSHFDPLKPYTRNLVATDGKTYTLLVLCWKGESPIHDHPCDGCWARVLQGSVTESRYKSVDGCDKLVCIQENVLEEGEVMFIEDSMGYHKIGCRDVNIPSVTLHLYCPPYKSCKIFLNKTNNASEANVCFYSIYGQIVRQSDKWRPKVESILPVISIHTWFIIKPTAKRLPTFPIHHLFSYIESGMRALIITDT